MTIAHPAKKKFAALTLLPFAAALTLSACSDPIEGANVNIQPLDTNVEVEDDTTAGAQTEVAIDDNDGAVTETSFTQSQNGVTMTLTYTAVGDVVTKQTTSNVIDYAAAGLTSKEEAQALLDPMLAQAADIEGYDQSIEYGETSATEEVSIDYQVVDMSQLEGLPGFEGSDNMEDADYISLDESRQMLEQQGFTVVD